MDCCDDRSACRRSTALFLLFVVISLLASSPLSRSRQTITTVAPICASASAVAFPIPELAPVTMQIFPCILLFTVGMIRSFLDILPMGKPRDYHTHECAFLLRVDVPGLVFTAPGLTASPQAD